ncbi:hypothetical protein [Xanthomonas sacchari]|uniref:Uncharacterized protein n=1 Tax=Xanthomonas sacchari TaxID=56458 RepID=A0AA46PQ65_9XANT|nr:hypothetical protein [Xanthomonas sacchari]UYK87057.1 hypothetical protein NG824_11025 [Xanthomonas sacchari]
MRVEQLKAFDSYFDDDGTPLQFCVDRKTIHVAGIRVVLNKLPYLKNPNTGEIHITTPAVNIINSYVSEAKGKQLDHAEINQMGRFERGELPVGRGTQFRYSAAEHFFIPGLVRNIPSDGYLTPVYFNRNVLTKYQYGEGYGIQSRTESFGSISISTGCGFPFGVNRAGNVVMWLGDLVGLDARELHYLYSENIDPQYDLHSDFYDSQILNKWI